MIADFAALIVVCFAILIAAAFVFTAAWGLWSKGYNQGYSAGLNEKINTSGRTIYEPYINKLRQKRDGECKNDTGRSD